MHARNVGSMTATHCGGIPSWKQNRPGMVRRVGPAAIGANSLVKHVTDVRMACGYSCSLRAKRRTL